MSQLHVTFTFLLEQQVKLVFTYDDREKHLLIPPFWYLPSLGQPHLLLSGGAWLVPGPCCPLLGCNGSGAISGTHGLGEELSWPSTTSPRNQNAHRYFCPAAAPLKVKGCHEVESGQRPPKFMGGRHLASRGRQTAADGRQTLGESQGTLLAIGSRLQGAQLQIHCLPDTLKIRGRLRQPEWIYVL